MAIVRCCLRFINHKPAFYIPASILYAGGFAFGHHDLYLFPEFKLGDKYRADYVLIGSGSGGYEFVFIEFESPNERITLKDGHSGQAIRKGNFQLSDWKRWIESHSNIFLMPGDGRYIATYNDKSRGTFTLPKGYNTYQVKLKIHKSWNPGWNFTNAGKCVYWSIDGDSNCWV